jgi:hypothetical protein
MTAEQPPATQPSCLPWWTLGEEPDPVLRVRAYEIFFVTFGVLHAVHRHIMERDRMDDQYPYMVLVWIASALVFLCGWRVFGLALTAGLHIYSAIAELPYTANHRFLMAFSSLLLLTHGTSATESRLVLGALRTQFIILVFWTGAQKVWWNTYTQGEFLMVFSHVKGSFQGPISMLMDPAELQRWRGLSLEQLDAGPFRSTSPMLILASNLSWIAEVFLPIGLLFHRTRVAATVLLIMFIMGIQVAAREVIFGTLATSTAALFLSANMQRRWMVTCLVMVCVLIALSEIGLVAGAAWN